MQGYEEYGDEYDENTLILYIIDKYCYSFQLVIYMLLSWKCSFGLILDYLFEV